MVGKLDSSRSLAGRLRSGPAAAALLVLVLSGCASFSPDGGMAVVANVAGETIHKEVVSIRTEDDALRADAATQVLLRRGLTVDSAVQIALLNNRGLQASYNELALAETDLVQAGLLPNPTFSIARIFGDGALEIERQVVGDILAGEASRTIWVRWGRHRSSDLQGIHVVVARSEIARAQRPHFE